MHEVGSNPQKFKIEAQKKCHSSTNIQPTIFSFAAVDCAYFEDED